MNRYIENGIFHVHCRQGIKAESIVFDNQDVEDMDDGEIQAYVGKSPLVKDDSSMTVKRLGSGFTFVNFGFAAD